MYRVKRTTKVTTVAKAVPRYFCTVVLPTSCSNFLNACGGRCNIQGVDHYGRQYERRSISTN